MAQTTAKNGDDSDSNPIDPWVFEICTKHGDVSASERFDQIAELVDRLANSTSISHEEGTNIEKEIRKSHRLMVETAEMRDCITEDECRALLNAFDRLVGAWRQSPTEIASELSEYRTELNHIREAQEAEQ